MHRRIADMLLLADVNAFLDPSDTIVSRARSKAQRSIIAAARRANVALQGKIHLTVATAAPATEEIAMARTVLGFSLRCATSADTDALAVAVAIALGVPLRAAWHEGKDAYVGSALGMTLALFPWGGPGGTLLVLEGAVTDAAFVLPPEDPNMPAARLDISDAVADLLEVKGAGSWHRPTPEELDAHTAWSRAHED